MKNKNKINEDDKFKIHIDPKTLSDPNKTKALGQIQKTNPNVEFDLEPTKAGVVKPMFEDGSLEPEAVIEPQDQATIKYLSNVIDNNTGEVSKPFVIGDKQYKMVRGIDNNQDIVMGVFCFDDMDADGNNMIHPVDYFEENVVMPMMEKHGLQKPTLDESNDYDYSAEEREYEPKKELDDFMNLNDVAGYEHFIANPSTGEVSAKFKTVPEMLSSGIKIGDGEEYMNKKTLQHIRNGVLGIKENKDSIGLSEYKHFLVNEKTGKFRKFKQIPELAEATVGEGERYMNLKEFKKYFEGKVFGGNRRKLNEQPPQPQTGQMAQPQQAQDIKADVDALYSTIAKNSAITNKIKRINNPIEKSQFLEKVAEMIGLDLKLFAQTIKNLKKLAKQNQTQATQPAQPIQEGKRVIKTIKVKDIK